MKSKLFCLTGTLLLFTCSAKVMAAMMISNLGVPWPEPGTIGDIQTIFSQQSFGMSFQTGNTPYQIDSITVEHFEYSASAARDLDLQIFRIGGLQSFPYPDTLPVSLVGELGNPVVDPRPTQWPGLTTFVTYTPVTAFTLEPNTPYMIAATWPTNNPGWASLLFAPGSYLVSGDWSESGRLTSQWVNLGDGWWQYSSMYNLKLEVNATTVPEPCSPLLILLGFAALSRQWAKRCTPGKVPIRT
jgi:hypothetical protein